MDFALPALTSTEKTAVQTCFDLLEANSYIKYIGKSSFFQDNKRLLSRIPLFQMFKVASQRQFEAIRGNRGFMEGKKVTKMNLCKYVYQQTFLSSHAKVLRVQSLLKRKGEFQAKVDAAEAKIKELEAEVKVIDEKWKGDRSPVLKRQLEDKLAELEVQKDVAHGFKRKIVHCTNYEKVFTHYGLTAARDEYLDKINIDPEDESIEITKQMVEAQWKLISIYRQNIQTIPPRLGSDQSTFHFAISSDEEEEEDSLTTTQRSLHPIRSKEEADELCEKAAAEERKADRSWKTIKKSMTQKEYNKVTKVKVDLEKIQKMSCSKYMWICIATLGFFALHVFITKIVWSERIVKVIEIDKANKRLAEAKANTIFAAQRQKDFLQKLEREEQKKAEDRAAELARIAVNTLSSLASAALDQTSKTDAPKKEGLNIFWLPNFVKSVVYS